MNDKTRKELSSMIEKLHEISDRFNEMGEEEMSKFDNLPEGLQDSERGQQLQDWSDTLTDASSSITDAIDMIEGMEDYV